MHTHGFAVLAKVFFGQDCNSTAVTAATAAAALQLSDTHWMPIARPSLGWTIPTQPNLLKLLVSELRGAI